RRQAGLKAIALKAMSLRVADRYPTPGELADEIVRWLDRDPVRAYPEPLWDRTARWVGRHKPLAVGLVAAVLLASISGTLYSQLRLSEARGQLSFTLLGGFVFDVLDRVQAELPAIPESEPLRRSLALQIQDNADVLLARWPDDARIREGAARAYWKVGNLR